MDVSFERAGPGGLGLGKQPPGAPRSGGGAGGRTPQPVVYVEPRARPHVGLARHLIRRKNAMMCPFCHQNVDDPCSSPKQVEQRAEAHVERCEQALKDEDQG